MELRFMALSVIGVLFLLSLQSFYALLYPAASFTGWFDISTLNANIFTYYNSNSLLNHVDVLSTVIFSGMIILFTVFLPSRYDLLTYIRRKKARRETE
jgi:preprotein translocase subunit SecY